MNKNNLNHTLLTKEELVNLLEKKSGEVVNLQELDEFEREAFEGFSVNSSPLEAQKMMGDMDLLLSQKLTELNSPTEAIDKKRGYLWFSLAASLALIIGLSILFFKKENAISEQNIALNEVTKKEVQKEKPSVVEQSSFESNTIIEAPKIFKAEKKSGPQKKMQPLIITNTNPAKPEAREDLKDKIATGAAYRSNSNSDEVLLEKETVIDSKLKYENTRNEKSTSMAESQPSSSSPVAANYTKYDADETKKVPAIDKEADMIFSENKTLAKKAMAKDASGANESSNTITTNAIYKMGTNDIKSFVLDYQKNKPFTQKLKGIYEVKATIKTNGKLVVDLIESIDKTNTMYVDYLQQALNAMKDWKPAYKNGKAIESITHFKLEF